MTPELRQSRAYTKAVNMPVNRKAHQTQLPDTPLVRTILVTRLGVSVENVVATIDVPSIHQGRLRPDRKKDSALPPARRLTSMPMISDINMKLPMMTQSIEFNCITFPAGSVIVRK